MFNVFDQFGVPIHYKPMMTIDLQEVVFTLVKIHYLRPRPASPPASAPVDIEHSNARIFADRSYVVLDPMLPTHPKAELVRVPCFGKTVPNGRNQLGVAIRCNGNEDCQRI
jgi:hypothetical protein